jgi:hypothetical protein
MCKDNEMPSLGLPVYAILLGGAVFLTITALICHKLGWDKQNNPNHVMTQVNHESMHNN